MINSINLRVDLSYDYINKDIITLHEGDVNGTELVLSVYDNNSVFDLSGCTAEYDATIDGCLAEEAAAATISDTNKIKVPVTSNMTALRGLLLIDVKIKKNNDILTVYTVSADVKRAVINGATIIDISGTVAQKLNNVLYQVGAAYFDNTPDSRLPSGAVYLKDATTPKQIYTVYSPQGFIMGCAFVLPIGIDGLIQYYYSAAGIKYRTKASANEDFGLFTDVSENYVDSVIGDIGTAIDALNSNIDTLNTNLSEV